MSKNTTGSIKCGWCITDVHESCKSQIVYYDKVWNCSCEKCNPALESEQDRNPEEDSDG